MNILLTCPTCAGESELPAPHLLLAVGADHPAQQAPGTIAWICPSCADLIAVKVDRIAVGTLLAGGATLVADEREDRRPVHPETAADGSPLTTDDLLVLHELLATRRWFDQLADLAGDTSAPDSAE